MTRWGHEVRLFRPGSEGPPAWVALAIEVPVEGAGVVDKVLHDLGGGGEYDRGFLGGFVKDQLVGELAGLVEALAAPFWLLGRLASLATALFH